MTYTPDVPLPTDLPSDSQQTFRTNFNELNTIFDENHFTFNYTTDSYRGKHRFVNFPLRDVDPGGLPGESGLGPTEIGLFNENLIRGDHSKPTELFMKRGGADEICLSGPEPHRSGTAGMTFLPGKLLLQWGSTNVPQHSSPNIDFYTDFGAAPYSITITVIRSAGSGTMNVYVLDGSVSASSFKTENTGSGAHDIYWMAIGKQFNS